MITNVEIYNALRQVMVKRDGSRQLLLMELYRLGAGTNQRCLVETLHVRPATVSEQLDVLIEQGYVQKTIDTIDKRATVIQLTDMGLREAKKLTCERDEKLTRLFKNLSNKDKEDLYDLLMRIVQR